MKTTNPFRVTALLAVLLFSGAAAQQSVAGAPEDILKHYLGVQSVLARDSMQNVSVNAHALAEAVRGDETKSLPPALAEQADALAKAKNLSKARTAFKPFSESIIAYFKSHRTPAVSYIEVYCPIAKASWLQAGETVRNPYLGPRSATPTWGWACAGIIKTKLENASSPRS